MQTDQYRNAKAEGGVKYIPYLDASHQIFALSITELDHSPGEYVRPNSRSSTRNSQKSLRLVMGGKSNLEEKPLYAKVRAIASLLFPWGSAFLTVILTNSVERFIVIHSHPLLTSRPHIDRLFAARTMSWSNCLSAIGVVISTAHCH